MNASSNAGHKWILDTIDQFTSWIEVVALKDAIENLVVEFLDGIVTRFGAPSTIISNNAKFFVGTHICSWAIDHGIYLSTSYSYYPQGNGLADSSNKNLNIVMKRTIEDN